MVTAISLYREGVAEVRARENCITTEYMITIKIIMIIVKIKKEKLKLEKKNNDNTGSNKSMS